MKVKESFGWRNSKAGKGGLQILLLAVFIGLIGCGGGGGGGTPPQQKYNLAGTLTADDGSGRSSSAIVPVVGAEVSVRGQSGKTALTNASGNFTLQNVLGGQIIVDFKNTATTNPTIIAQAKEILLNKDMNWGTLPLEGGCGNGVKEGAEKCDTGASNGQACVPQYGGVCNYCSSTCAEVSVEGGFCNDGIVQDEEGCDDGNMTDGDGCSSACVVENPVGPVCPNAQVEQGETCDSNVTACNTACYAGTKTCNATCNGWLACNIGAKACGNGAKEGCEACDDSNLVSNDGCSSACQIETPNPECGNDILESGEQCDDGVSNGIVCAPAYNSSCNYCSASCQTVNVAGETCGDGNINGPEECDVTVGTATCQTQGSDGGTLVCNNATCLFDTSDCATCGNGTQETGETCDDGNTTTEPCAYGQTSCVVCSSVCTNVNGATARCGDSVTNATNGETCDDDNTTTEICSYGQTSCSVCNSTCHSASGATTYCGDGATQSGNGEACDGGTQACSSGLYDGTNSCLANCSGYSSTCDIGTKSCGNGLSEDRESCDDGASNGTPGNCNSTCDGTVPDIPAWATPTFVLKWGSLGTGNTQFDSPRDGDTDEAGNVYIADQQNDRVLKFDPNGNWLATYGPAIVGTTNLNGPEAVCVSRTSGIIGITDYGNARVVLLDSSGNYLREFGSYGQGEGQFDYPRGCAFGADDDIFVAGSTPQVGNTANHNVQKFGINGNFIKAWGQLGSTDGYFNNALGIAVGFDGFVYVSDSGNFRVQKFTQEGQFVTKWSSGDLAYIAIDSNGRVYAVDYGNAVVQVYNPDGTQVGQVGAWGTQDGGFFNPIGIAIFDTTVYVVDPSRYGTYGDNMVQKFVAP